MIAFCRLFIVLFKNVCYERKVQGELLGSYFHYTLEWLRPQVPTTSIRLMMLGDRVECQCYKHPYPVNSKNTAKSNIMFNFVLSSQIDFIQYKFEHYKQYLISENHSKDTLNHRELCEIAIQCKETYWLACSYFFVVELFLEFL